MASVSKGLKSLYYAGVGAGTYCYEAAENVLNKFIEKGKESVTDNKSRNEKIKADVKQNYDETISKLNNDVKPKFEDFVLSLGSFTEDQLKQIKNTIIKKEAEAPKADEAKPADAEDVTETADAAKEDEIVEEAEAEAVEEAPAEDDK